MVGSPSAGDDHRLYIGGGNASQRGTALGDLGEVHVQAYSLGESNFAGPRNTAMLGFSGIGGPILLASRPAAKSH